MKNHVLSYRVRLARNLSGLPFPHRMSEEQKEMLFETVTPVFTEAAGGGEFSQLRLNSERRLEATALAERHLISKEMASGGGVIIQSRDGSVCVMLGEEDHIRVQVFGRCPEKALETALSLDDLLWERLTPAYDERLGYLTACPTNLGTGMRASALLHLPALTASGRIPALAQRAAQTGLTIRGLYGEGSKNSFGYIQLSNRVTLGVKESDLAKGVQTAALALTEEEAKALAAICKKDRNALADRVWRAYGLLRYAKSLAAEEAMDAISSLRTGVTMNELDIESGELNALMHDIQPTVLALSRPEAKQARERDILRAEICRDFILRKDG